MTFYAVLNIGIIIVSPLNPLFPSFLHHHCLQILYTTNFLRENVFYILYIYIHACAVIVRARYIVNNTDFCTGGTCGRIIEVACISHHIIAIISL